MRLVRLYARVAIAMSVARAEPLLLPTCEMAGCDAVYSEDLNAGEDYDGVALISRFANSALGRSASA